MATPESSLSVAMQHFAEFLSSRFEEGVIVTLDTPQKAQEQAKADTNHVLNLFVYRIAPSGFHADTSDAAHFFIRAYILITAFPSGQGNPPSDSDLRVLGQAVRILQSFPVIPGTLPGAAPAGAPTDFRRGPTTDYQMQAILQAPTMEELNHIWTTQGGDLAYRLSAAYELALIPIEPLTHAPTAPDVTDFELVTAVGVPPIAFQMFQQGGQLVSRLSVVPATATATVNLTGAPQTRVGITVDWVRSDGTKDQQTLQLFDVQTSDTDAPQAVITVALDAAAAGDTASLNTVLVDTTTDEPIAKRAPANAINLIVEV